MSKKEKPRRRKKQTETNDGLVKWRAVIPVLFGAVMTGAKWGEKMKKKNSMSWWAPGNISCLLALLLRELCCCFLDTRRQGH